MFYSESNHAWELSRPWPVFRANMRSSRNLMFVRDDRRWNSAHGSIFGTRMSMIWALPQIRNRPDVFSHGLPTRAVTIVSLEKYFYWDDILEFWALNQHFGERMDHGSRPISAYDQLLKGRQGRPGPRGPHSSNIRSKDKMIVETKSRSAVNIPLFAVPSQLQIGIKTMVLRMKKTKLRN